MLVYFVAGPHQYTMGRLLEVTPALRNTITVVPYERSKGFRPPAECRAVVFSDLERLGPTGRAVAIGLQQSCARSSVPVLNHPNRAMCRYELLRTLHERGTNAFDVYRLTEARLPRRYPVFLRGESDHEGTLGDLVEDENALGRRIEALVQAGVDRTRLIITEFIDVRDATGRVHKYSSLRIGDRIVARHRFESQDSWCLKHADLVNAETIEREWKYLRESPHATELMALFDLAHIEYGRVDYAVVDGRLQVFEINTNPMTFQRSHFEPGPRQELQRHAHRVLVEAFLALDG